MELKEFYLQGLIRGLVISRTKKMTGFRSLRGVSLSKQDIKSIKRGTQWILTHAGASYKVKLDEVEEILKEVGINTGVLEVIV